MERLIVLAYDLAAVLILLQAVAFSARRGFATGIFRMVGQLPHCSAQPICPAVAHSSSTTAF